MNGSRSRGGTLSPEALARYEHDGFFFPLDVLDPGEVAAMRTQLEDFEERYESHPAVGHGAFRTSCHLFLPFLDDLIRHPAILDAVSSILGRDLLVWGTSFFTKEPRSRTHTLLRPSIATTTHGLRTASGATTEANTAALIANMGEYRRLGVNLLAVYCQGSSGGMADCFYADGRQRAAVWGWGSGGRGMLCFRLKCLQHR